MKICIPEKIDEKHVLEISAILRECNDEFIPPLVSRASTFQADFLSEQGESSINEYLSTVLNQHNILAVDSKQKILGFMSFSTDNKIETLKNYDYLCYVSTACVSHDYRKKGICGSPYRFLFDWMIENNMKHASTRTWSTNYPHIKILENFDFKVIKTIKNHRGKDIHTVYFLKQF